MSWMSREFMNKWPLVLCEARNGNLTRNRKQTGGTSFASPPVLAKPRAGSALTVCDKMLQFMINATMYRGDLHLLFYELDIVQNATSPNLHFFSLSLNDPLRPEPSLHANHKLRSILCAFKHVTPFKVKSNPLPRSHSYWIYALVGN